MYRPNLTQEEIVSRLYAPFVASDHEFHGFFKFCYVKEEAINRRLSSVFGLNWSKVVTERVFIPEGEPVIAIGKVKMLLSQYSGEIERSSGSIILPGLKDYKVIYDIPAILVHGYIEVVIDGVRYQRHSTGGDVLTDLGKERGAQIMNTYKASDTDLLKRAARQWGVGLYLTQLSTSSTKIEDEAQLAGWLKREYGVLSESEAKTKLKADFFSDSTPEEIRNTLARYAITTEDLCTNYAMCHSILSKAA